jgi:hypothetical protein
MFIRKVSACIVFSDKDGVDQYDIAQFGTFTDELMRLRSWLLEHDCPVAAMESTGIYWRPVHNVLEDSFRVILVNARDIKNVPGRKNRYQRQQMACGIVTPWPVESQFHSASSCAPMAGFDAIAEEVCSDGG